MAYNKPKQFPVLILCFLIFTSPNLLFVNTSVSHYNINSNIKYICNPFLWTHINHHKSLEISYSAYYGFIFVKSLCNTILNYVSIYYYLFIILHKDEYIHEYTTPLPFKRKKSYFYIFRIKVLN